MRDMKLPAVFWRRAKGKERPTTKGTTKRVKSQTDNNMRIFEKLNEK